MESPFDIDRVEWAPSTGEVLEVRVCGRWRGSAPAALELLVNDESGERRRFVATGAATDEAGSWRATFLVPVELRSRLASRLALQAGDRELALPAASPGPADEAAAPPPATVVEPTVLAQRRAAREGQADEALVRRAQAAEATATTLETQLDHLEARLRETLIERDRTAARLRAAEQREQAERRVRTEAEDERDAIASEVERQVTSLRARARAAEEHATALGAEMDDIRREAAEAQHAASAARFAAERAVSGGAGEHAQAELDRLGAEAAELAARLEREHAVRLTAEAELARQGDRVAEVEATVALLEHEFDRRATVQNTVQGEIETLREALAAVRTQTEESANRDGGAQRALDELKSIAAGLRVRIGTLEASERSARMKLRETQSELSSRGRDLDRARVDVERSRAELAAAHAAQDSTASALREAERTVVTVRQQAAELQGRLEDERRRRFEAEASVKIELERERERFGNQVGEIEGELRARIAAERQAFDEQAGAIEALVSALRQRLTTAGAHLEQRLAGEQMLREEALAERDAALAGAEAIKLELARDLERAATEREALVARLAKAAAERDLLAGTLAERDDELTRLRAMAEDSATRDGAIEALVADVLATAGSLRDGFDRRLLELSERVEAEVLTLRAQLEEERTARWVVEQELAAERSRGVQGGVPSVLASLNRSELEATRQELAAAQEQLAAERSHSAETAELREHASQLVHNLEAAEARLKLREEQPVEPAVAEDRLGDVPSRDEEAGPGPGLSEDPVVEEGTSPEEPAVEEVVAQETSAVELLAALERDVAAMSDVPVEPASAPQPAAGDEGALPSGPPPGARPLPTRYVRPSERPLIGWLTPAIAKLAETEPAQAAELVLELLPAQAGLVREPVRYVLTIDGFGTYRVGVERDRATVEANTTPDHGGIDVHVAGRAGALAALVAGGTRRRMPGVRIEGRRRRVRKLLRARRAPLDLSRLSDRGIRPSPRLVLAVMCAAVDPTWTSGHNFNVVYALGGGETVEIEVRDGRGLSMQPAARPRTQAPAATISVRDDALFPLLTRLRLPDGERVLVAGDRHAVSLLHSWFDRAQGLPGG